ncbi:MAG: hypothetical protein WBE18_01290 [Gammaproteobacteria bacterium]
MSLEIELAAIKDLIGNELTRKPGETRWSITVTEYTPAAHESIAKLLQENGFTAKVDHFFNRYSGENNYTLSLKLSTSVTQAQDKWAQQLLTTVLQQQQEELEQIKQAVLQQVSQNPDKTSCSITVNGYTTAAREAIVKLLQENGFQAKVDCSGQYDEYSILSFELPASVTLAQDEWAQQLLEMVLIKGRQTVLQQQQEELEQIKQAVLQQVSQNPGKTSCSITVNGYTPTAREAIAKLLQENGFTAKVDYYDYGFHGSGYNLHLELPASVTQAQDEWAQQLLETVQQGRQTTLQKQQKELERIKQGIFAQVSQNLCQTGLSTGQTGWSINITNYDFDGGETIKKLLEENGFTTTRSSSYNHYDGETSYTLFIELPTSETKIKDEWPKKVFKKMQQKLQEELEKIKQYILQQQVSQKVGETSWLISINGSMPTREAIKSLLPENGFTIEDHGYYQLSLKLPSLETKIKDEWAKQLLAKINYSSSVFKAKTQLSELILQALKADPSDQKQLEIKPKDVYALNVFTEFLEKQRISAGISSTYDLEKDLYILKIDTKKLVACETNDVFINQLQQAVIDSQKRALSAAVSHRDAAINNNNNVPPQPPAASSSRSSNTTNAAAAPNPNLQIDKYKQALNDYLTTQIGRIPKEEKTEHPKYKALYDAQREINRPDVDLLTIKEQVKAIKEAVEKHEVTDGFIGFFNKFRNTESHNKFIKLLKEFPELANDKNEAPAFRY